MNREFPTGMNEKCRDCPTAKLVVDIIEDSLDKEAADALGNQIKTHDSLPEALSALHFRAIEDMQESSGTVAETYGKMAQTARETLVSYTSNCDGTTRRLFGKRACSQDVRAQALMLPFMSGVDPRYPEAQAIQQASDRLLED